MDGTILEQNFICQNCGEVGKHTYCNNCWREVFRKEFNKVLDQFNKTIADLEAANQKVIKSYESVLKDANDIAEMSVKSAEDTKKMLDELFPGN